jgi:hypothetical protein
MSIMTIAPRCAAAAILLLAAATGARATAEPAPVGPPVYTPARECAECHRTIHKYWSESQHARAAESPAFRAALAGAVAAGRDKAALRRECAWCHVPTALVTGDWEMEGALAREGVTCDFCHTVAGVALSRTPHPFDLDPGPVKRGPMEYAKTPAHETAYSVLHKSSALLCASCHEYKNALGAPVLSTFSEWDAGPYPANGRTCQECHMPLVPGDTVEEALQPTQRRINLHRMTGGADAGRMAVGLELKLASVTIGARSADVEVVVSNTGVGHSAPGGLSTKSLVLAVGIDAGGPELVNRRQRVYRREMRDAQGRTLSSAADMFLKAASVGEDSRLRQKESRTERFTVPLPEGWKAVVARLEYHDASDPAAPTTRLVTEQRRERGR